MLKTRNQYLMSKDTGAGTFMGVTLCISSAKQVYPPPFSSHLTSDLGENQRRTSDGNAGQNHVIHRLKVRSDIEICLVFVKCPTQYFRKSKRK